jgi:hypothetical protein
LPALLVGAGGQLAWLLLLAASPQLALLAQLGLSRVREFDADRLAAELTATRTGWRQRWRNRAGQPLLACLAAARMGQSGTLLVAHASGDG